MTQKEINTENALVKEKHEVIKKLANHLHQAQFNRTQLTSDMLKELREKINTLIKNDF